MKPNPLTAVDIPKDWPTHGESDDSFAGGPIRRVNLRDAWATLSFGEISTISVEIPGKGKRWPWKQIAEYPEVLTRDSPNLLARASADVSDRELEAWARDKHGITIDLSDDEPDTQRIRADAVRRFLSERSDERDEEERCERLDALPSQG